MTNMSAFSLGYGGLLASILGSDRTLFIFSFKFFHALSYFVGLIAFAYSVRLTKTHAFLQWAWISLIGFLPLIVFELTGNYADYYVLLGAMFIGYQLVTQITNLPVAMTRAALLWEALALGLFAIVSLKCIPYIIAYFILKGLLCLIREGGVSTAIVAGWHKRNQLFAQAGLMITPLMVLLIDNFRLTGNPTFPGGNHLWQSPFFMTSGVVAERFKFPNNADGTTFLQLFSLTPQAAEMFSSGNSYFPIYGLFFQSLLFAIPMLLVLLLVYIIAGRIVIKTAFSSFLLGLGCLLLTVLSFGVITQIVGPQHRYFFGLPVFILLGVIALLAPFLELVRPESTKKKYLWRALGWISIPLSLFLFFANASNPPPFHITADHMLVSKAGFDKWLKKRAFYTELNKRLEGDYRKIMLYYLQDKFFIDTKNVYEMDWYDYPMQRTLINEWEKGTSLDARLENIRDRLCKENFGYFVLSTDAIFFDPKFKSKYLNKTSLTDDLQALYELKCLDTVGHHK